MKKKLFIALLITSIGLTSCKSWQVSTGTSSTTPDLVGQRVNVLYASSWYPATILKVSGNTYYIHYTNWSDTYDEWVTADRIQFTNYGVGQLIQVYDNSTWYDATILNTRGNEYYIHFNGWGSSYDKWVTSDKVRPK